MSFSNRIRLPFKITRPQYPVTKTAYTRADGSIKTQSVIIGKTYEGETDYFPERWHERLIIALGHDNVSIEGDKYLGGVNLDGDYEIDWQTFLDYPTAKAKFKVDVTPFDGTNSNCQSCEEVSQVVANDDMFPAPLEEDTTYSMDVSANDNICCFPNVYSIIYNSIYIDLPTITNEGLLTIHTKTGLTAANKLLLVTYRITCPNGGFDEANVYADINGSVEGCLAPVNLVISAIDSSSATATWEEPSPAPSGGYHVEVFSEGSGIVFSADTTDLTILLAPLGTGLDFTVSVVSLCDGDTQSNPAQANFSTNPLTVDCGSYSLNYNNPGDADAAHGGHDNVNYMGCNGVVQTVYVPNFVQRGICAKQTGPGSPVNISPGNSFTTVTYLGLCP